MWTLDNIPPEILFKTPSQKEQFVKTANKALSEGKSVLESKFQGVLSIKHSRIAPEDKIVKKIPQHVSLLSQLKEESIEKLNQKPDVFVKEVTVDSSGFLITEYSDGTRKKSNKSIINNNVMVAGGFSSSTSTNQPTQEEEVYSEKVDFYNSTDCYKGQAQPGTSTSSPVWRIKKIEFAVDGDVTTTWASASASFDKIWDNRASYTYS